MPSTPRSKPSQAHTQEVTTRLTRSQARACQKRSQQQSFGGLGNEAEVEGTEGGSAANATTAAAAGASSSNSNASSSSSFPAASTDQCDVSESIASRTRTPTRSSKSTSSASFASLPGATTCSTPLGSPSDDWRHPLDVAAASEAEPSAAGGHTPPAAAPAASAASASGGRTRDTKRSLAASFGGDGEPSAAAGADGNLENSSMLEDAPPLKMPRTHENFSAHPGSTVSSSSAAANRPGSPKSVANAKTPSRSPSPVAALRKSSRKRTPVARFTSARKVSARKGRARGGGTVSFSARKSRPNASPLFALDGDTVGATDLALGLIETRDTSANANANAMGENANEDADVAVKGDLGDGCSLASSDDARSENDRQEQQQQPPRQQQPKSGTTRSTDSHSVASSPPPTTPGRYPLRSRSKKRASESKVLAPSGTPRAKANTQEQQEQTEHTTAPSASSSAASASSHGPCTRSRSRARFVETPKKAPRQYALKPPQTQPPPVRSTMSIAAARQRSVTRAKNRTRVQKLGMKVDQLRKEKVSSNELAENLQSLVDELKQEIATKNNEIRSLRKGEDPAITQFHFQRSLRNQLEAALADSKAAQEALQVSRQNELTLKLTIEQLQSEKSSLQKQMESDSTAWQAQVGALESKIVGMKESLGESRTRETEALRRESDVSMKFAQVVNEKCALQNDAHAKSLLISQLKVDVDKFSTLVAKSAAEHDALKARMRELEALGAERSSHDAELSKMKAEIATLNAHLAEKEANERELRADLSEKAAHLTEKEAVERELRSDLEDRDAQVESLEARVRNLEATATAQSSVSAAAAQSSASSSASSSSSSSAGAVDAEQKSTEQELADVSALARAREELEAFRSDLDALTQDQLTATGFFKNDHNNLSTVCAMLLEGHGKATGRLRGMRQINEHVQATLDRALESEVALKARLAEFEQLAEEAERRFGALTEELNEEKKKRRQLQNENIDLKGSIRIYCRIRPQCTREKQQASSFSSSTSSSTASIFDETDPMIRRLNDEKLVLLEQQEIQKKSAAQEREVRQKFEFDRVFGPESTQVDVFRDVTQFVHAVMDGYNVCIFAYGQTGSGKTFTMEGGAGAKRGVNYRALDEVFKSVRDRKPTHEYSVSVSVLEVHNNEINDLLSGKKNLKLSDVHDKIKVRDLSSVPVYSSTEVTELMKNTAFKHRSVGRTNMNEHSSRSHCLLFVNVECTPRDEPESATTGRLVLVDLAGSERLDRSGAEGKTRTETQEINKSLSALSGVMRALKVQAQHVPYRNSTLTHLLKECLSGNSKALMFCQVSPDSVDYAESSSSLKFATDVRGVERGRVTKNKKNVVSAQDGGQGGAPAASEIARLKSKIAKDDKEIKNLKRQINLHERLKQRQQSRPTTSRTRPVSSSTVKKGGGKAGFAAPVTAAEPKAKKSRSRRRSRSAEPPNWKSRGDVAKSGPPKNKKPFSSRNVLSPPDASVAPQPEGVKTQRPNSKAPSTPIGEEGAGSTASRKRQRSEADKGDTKSKRESSDLSSSDVFEQVRALNRSKKRARVDTDESAESFKRPTSAGLKRKRIESDALENDPNLPNESSASNSSRKSSASSSQPRKPKRRNLGSGPSSRLLVGTQSSQRRSRATLAHTKSDSSSSM